MSLLTTLVLTASLAGSPRPIATVEPDSGSVAFTTDTVWLQTTPAASSVTRNIARLPRGAEVRVLACEAKACSVEFRRLQGFVLRAQLQATPLTRSAEPDVDEWDALELLMGEHQLSIPILQIERRFSPSGPKVAMSR